MTSEIYPIQTLRAHTESPIQLKVTSTNPKGNVFPLDDDASRVGRMHRRLTEPQIRATCRELVAANANLTGRQLRRELKRRFGAVGKTERVFALWREETAVLRRATAAADLPTDIAELQRRLKAAEETAAENLKRAELAEYRERAHQDHWAIQIDQLKQQLQSQAQESGQGLSRPFSV